MKNAACLFALPVLLTFATGCENESMRRERAVKKKNETYVFEQTAAPATPPADAAQRWSKPDGGAPSLTLLAGMRGSIGALDGVGEEARLGRISAMATADFRTVYFADSTFHTLRTYDVATREVRTVAGVADSSGAEDGARGKARFFGPGGIAMQGAKTIFVSDSGNQSIRRFDVESGQVETIAGVAGKRGTADGPARSALFDYPIGIAFAGGRLYIADTGGRALRVLDLEQRTVSTLKTDLTFASPIAIAAGRADEIFVSDSLLDGIYSVKISTGETRLIAGVGTFGYPAHRDGVGNEARLFEPRELSYDAAHNALIVVDQHNAAIRQIDLGTGDVTTIAGLGVVRTRTDGEQGPDPVRPRGILLDDKGHVFFSDNGELRSLTPQSKAVEVLAGRRRVGDARDGLGEAARLGTIGGLALDDAGNVLFGDCGSGRLRRVDAKTGGVETLTSERMAYIGPRDVAEFGCPSGIASDGRGNIIVADRARAAIYNVRISPPNVSVIAGAPRICDAHDGSLEAARFCNPVQLAYDRATNQVFVTDGTANTIRRIDLAARTVATVAGKAFAAGHVDATGEGARFAQPAGMVKVGGLLYVADRDNHCIRTVDTASGTVATFVGRPGVRGDVDGAAAEATLDEPTDVRANASGTQLFVIDRNSIRVVDIAGRRTRRIIRSREGIGLHLGPLPTALHTPTALLPLSDDALAVGDSGEGAIVIATGY